VKANYAVQNVRHRLWATTVLRRSVTISSQGSRMAEAVPDSTAGDEDGGASATAVVLH
jgi:hypothetical protein